jgi:hypothetical protein
MKLDRQRLLYRRQFIMGPRFVEELSFWRRCPIRPGLCLTIHPDLSTHHICEHGQSVTLLGFILDPNNPEHDDSAVLASLLNDVRVSQSLDDFFFLTYSLGGWWALIVDNGQDAVIFHDPAGLRQIVYAIDRRGSKSEVWSAAQPSLLTKVIDMTSDEEVLGYRQLAADSDPECWWPGERTTYEEVKQLLPNHYLNLADGSVHRYWPRNPSVRLPLEESTALCSRILEGMMNSACHRFKVRLQITAGVDSRVVMAASRQFKDQMDGFTLQLGSRDPDVQIGSRLAAKMQLPRYFVVKPFAPDAEFQEICRASVDNPHESWQSRMICHTVPPLADQRVSATGHVSEVGRCFYDPFARGQKTYRTADDIVSTTSLPRTEFIISEVDRWLSEWGDPCNYHILDLFYWEHRLGRWLTNAATEFAMVHQGFSPYNCRQLLTLILAVDEEYRRPPACLFHLALVNKMWPLLLSEPINPLPNPGLTTRIADAARHAAKGGLRHLGLSDVHRWLRDAAKKFNRATHL